MIKETYIFCFNCVEMYKVAGEIPICAKLVIGCENMKVCPECRKHLDPFVSGETQAEVREQLKILVEETNND